MAHHHGVSHFYSMIAEALVDEGSIAVESSRSAVKEGVFQFFRTNFGRLLPKNEAVVSIEALQALAATMNGGVDVNEASHAPAGFIFLGQFIDHDITRSAMTVLGSPVDPEKVENLRTPGFDLDSLYLGNAQRLPLSEGLMRVGNAGHHQNDLPREVTSTIGQSTVLGNALIGDDRNDENGIISQLHLLFLKFHNAVFRKLKSRQIAPILDHGDLFAQTARIVRWHYQWLVRNEYLPMIIQADVLAQAERWVFGEDEMPEVWQNAPVMPVEFAAAAFRFGHSQVRDIYRLNASKLAALFKRVELDIDAMSFFSPVPQEDVIDWRYFFEVDDTINPQLARKIDAKMASQLFTLPGVVAGSDGSSLALRNLIRGSQTFNLPTGEMVAKAFCVDPIEIAPADESLKGATPLWFYCLKEAEMNNGRLGSVGGQIVAMVILRLLKESTFDTYVDAENWKPFLGQNDTFTMVDMVKVVQEMESELIQV